LFFKSKKKPIEQEQEPQSTPEKPVNLMINSDINNNDMNGLVDSLNFTSNELVTFNKILGIKLNECLEEIVTNIPENKTAMIRGKIEIINELLNLQTDRNMRYSLKGDNDAKYY